ncbi:MAG: hypothetical protein ACM3TR_14055 [Caulobacteraceae bacterium]
MKLNIGYDGIKIYAPYLPVEQALSGMKQEERSLEELYYIKHKLCTNVVYRNIAYGEGITILFNPCLKTAYIKEVPVSILCINADGLTPSMIRDIALRIYGTLDKLTIAYIESKVDIDETDFNTIAKNLLVMGKKIAFDKFQGETLYFGKRTSRNEISLYDKGLQHYGVKDTLIRIEARNRFIKKEQPLLIDFLTGKWRQENPFRKTLLINSEELPLTRNEKISLSKRGLALFYMNLSKARKDVLARYFKDLVTLDLNAVFQQWEEGWLAANDDPDMTSNQLEEPISDVANEGIININQSDHCNPFARGDDG